MEAIEFLKEYQRICHFYHTANCNGCPLEVCGCNIANDDVNEIVKIVKEWSKAHPRKTIIQDFIEKFPNAPLNDHKIPTTCPKSLGYKGRFKCSETIDYCFDCWNRPLED